MPQQGTLWEPLCSAAVHLACVDDEATLKEWPMKALSAAVALVVLAASAGSAFAHLSTGERQIAAEPEWNTVVPIRPNARGVPSCPSNFVIRGKVCVSTFAGRGALNFSAGDRDTASPWINGRGQLQCPSNFVLRRKLCVSLYY
jgi:hypothetical protein